MAKYIIHNKSTKSITFDISHSNGRSAHHVNIPRNESLDILPLAGTIESCKLIPGVYGFKLRNMIDIIIED